MTKHRMPNGIVCAALLGLLATASATAQDAVRSGQQFVNETTLLEKTDNGREFRRIVTHYNWDDGVTYRKVYDKAGKLVETRQSKLGYSPDEDEIQHAFDLVAQDPDVQAIRRSQAGIEIAGGFTHLEKTGKCAAPARCIQVFVFDGENVVRHMMVDLRIDKIVDHNYTPPRNRGN